jgi:translation elongation factor P/translation initiation factor 5A
MDNYSLFDPNDNGIENGYFLSTKTNSSRIITRTIKLKDISEGRVVKINFDGATNMTIATVDPRDYISVP